MRNKIHYSLLASCCLVLTVYYLFFLGCGLNNPFSPPEAPVPEVPQLLTPDNGAEIGRGRKVSFSWSRISNSTYSFQISEDNSFNTMYIDTQNLTSESYEAVFNDTAEYFWRVRAQTKSYMKLSEWSEIRNFKVLRSATNPPLIPYSPSPEDRADSITITTALSWWSGDPDTSDTVTYSVFIGTDSASMELDTVLKDGRRICPAYISYIPATQFVNGQKYFWQVKAEDEDGETTGPIWSFSTGAPAGNRPPVIDTPIVPSWVYADEECVFKVSATDPDGDSVSYFFYFGDTDSGWSSRYASGDTVDVTHIYRRFNYIMDQYAPFYMKVKARDVWGAESSVSWPCSIFVKANAGAAVITDETEAKILKISAVGSVLAQYKRPTGTGFAPVNIAYDNVNGSIVASSPGQDRLATKINPYCIYEWEAIRPGTTPTDVVVASDGIWVCCTQDKHIRKLDKNTGAIIEAIITNPSPTSLVMPLSIALDEVRNVIWVGEMDFGGSGNGWVSKFDLTTKQRLCQLSGFTITWLEVNPENGYCWVGDVGMDGISTKKVAKISPDNVVTVVADAGFLKPFCISLYPAGGYLWVSDSSRVRKLSFNGEFMPITDTNFEEISGLATDTRDGSCWVVDRVNKKVVKLDNSGNILFEITDFTKPWFVAVNPNPDP